MNIILIGVPGAGKSTQGNLLSKQLHLPYLSTGHIFRILAKEKTPQARYIKELLTAGKLIPDDEAIPIVEEYLNRKEYKKGFILDGFPRTVAQAKKFKHTIDKVVYITLPDKEALWRIAHRTEQRDDQGAATIIGRINTFHKKTDPVIAHYEKEDLLSEIDGSGTIEEVNEEILRNLGKQHVKNHIENWKNRKKTILAVTGLPGAGKTEASEYLKKELDVPVVHFGAKVTSEVERRKLDHTEKNHKTVRMEFRQKHGMEALAKLSVQEVEVALKDTHVIVIDDLYSFEEYEYLKQQFPDVAVELLLIWADKNVRYDRIKSRKHDRPKLYGEERDLNQIIEANQGATIAFSDHILVNDGSLEDLHYKLDHIYREIYFGLE